MIKTRSEKLVFGVLMSVTMAIGMEVYNVAIKMGYKLPSLEVKIFNYAKKAA